MAEERHDTSPLDNTANAAIQTAKTAKQAKQVADGIKNAKNAAKGAQAAYSTATAAGGSVAGSTIGTAIAGPLGTVVGFLVTNKTFQKVVAAIMAAILLFLFIIVNFIGILFSYLGFMDANSFANEAQSKELAAIRSRIEQVLEVEAYQTELLSIISQEHDMKLQEIQADYQANYREHKLTIVDEYETRLKDKELVCSYTKIYSKKNYESEQKAVIQLAALSRYPIKRYDVEKWISGLESKENIQLAEKQRKGIEMVFQNPVSIITGGPGSGKTTLLRFIVMIQEKLNIDSMILLAAPTGRARQRMYEATGYPALTIHKSIGLTGADGEEAWNAGEMLCDDLIIIDECSMVDMHLFTSLMMKIKTGSRIVFVGDKDQLESVGPGNVFKELIDSRVIPVTVLDQCFRQENPTILENAIKINCGKQNLVYDNSFSFVAAHDDEEAAKKIMKLFDMEWKLQRKNVNAVQVLTPLREDTKVSANALNLKIKDRINPHQIGQQEIKNGNKIFRIQDKVMQTKNEDEISNGDIGIVRKIGKVSGKKYMEVDFGEERVMRYQEGESWNLVHAYAITAHKGQGSEYPVVIIPILSCFRRHTLKRNLYYTAITRAKRKVILVGSKQAFSQAIRAGRSKKRNTLLSYRLKKAFTEVLDKNEAA